MRKKKGNPLVAPALNKAWAQFYEAHKEDDLDALAAEGWKTLGKMVEESGQPLQSMTSRMKKLVQQKAFEKKIVRGMTRNGVREVALYRPVGKECQRRANSTVKG